MTLNAAALIQAIRQVQAACPSAGDTTPDPSAWREDWMSDWSSDRRCEAEENRRWRGLP